jgi:Fe2+ transport system protein FeoA
VSILSALPMTVAQVGQEVRVHSVRTDEQQAQRLRELGILEGRTIRVIANNDPLICQIGECRFGVCRRLARFILVEPVRRSA